MYTPEERDLLRTSLLERARTDPRIAAAAITGSAAGGCEDQWSDIDLAFSVGHAAEMPELLAGWTAYMYQQHLAAHHFDVMAGAWIYRVFLLPSTLQVDLAFVSAEEFRALKPTFRLMFGTANEPRHIPPPASADLIGLAWLYALHARSSIARGKLWQAEYMVSGVRDHALALCCLRHGLPTDHGRGIDQLPGAVMAQFARGLVRQLDTAELSRAFRSAIQSLLSEIRSADEALADRLQAPLTHLTHPK